MLINALSIPEQQDLNNLTPDIICSPDIIPDRVDFTPSIASQRNDHLRHHRFIILILAVFTKPKTKFLLFFFFFFMGTFDMPVPLKTESAEEKNI